MELGLKLLLLIGGLFLAALVVCFDAYAVGLVAEHAYTLLIAPNVASLPALSWKVFTGAAFVIGVMTMKSNDSQNSESKPDDASNVFTRYAIMVVAYMAIGWLA